MADIRIHRDHQLGLAKARKVAWDWAEQVEKEFDMECTVLEGETSDTVEFTRSGVNGTLVVAPDHFELHAKLGLLLGAWLAVARFPGRSVALTLLNTFLAIPSVVVGLVIYLLLSRSGPLGFLGWLFSFKAMVLAQAILVLPLVTALTRQVVEDADRSHGEQLSSLGAGLGLRSLLMAWDERYALLTVLITAFGRAVSEVISTLPRAEQALGPEDQDLHQQHDGQHATECVGIVQVAGNRIGNEAVIHQTRQRKARIDPLLDAGGRLVTRMATHCVLSPQPIVMTVSDVNAKVGTGWFVGAGPLRIRPAVS